MPTHATRSTRKPTGNEAAIVDAWQQRAFEQPITDSAGHSWMVVYPGRRSGTPGPDFRDAILAAEDATLVHGDVEVHQRAADWYAHGHQRDPAYNNVVLQVVGQPPAVAATLANGVTVPSFHLKATRAQLHVLPGIVCPPDDRAAAAAALDAAGDSWFEEHARLIEADVDLHGEDQALWARTLRALGFGGIEDEMRALAFELPWLDITGLLGRGSRDERTTRAAAALLDAGGLKLSDEEARLYSPRFSWSPIRWPTIPMRPANRPESRIRAAASLAAGNSDGLAGAVTSLIDRAASSRELVRLTRDSFDDRIGEGRAAVLAVNVFLPFASLAGSEMAGKAGRLFAGMPKLPPNQYTSYMIDLLFAPDARHLVNSARRQQGILRTYRGWCRDKNCGECPVGIAARGAVPPAHRDGESWRS